MIYHAHVKPPNCLYFQCSYCVVCLKCGASFLAEGLQIHVSRWCSAGQSLYIKAATFGSRKSCLSSSSAHCLAVLFEYFINEASPSAKCSSAVDVGLCKPVSGSLLARSFRGRDRRKMISWKDMACTSGYPY